MAKPWSFASALLIENGPDSLAYTRVLEWIELPVVQRLRCS